MKTFHVDEPREIGQKRDSVSSKEMRLAKDELVEHLVKEHTCIFCGNLTNEDLRKWFGKGGAGGTSTGGWDRYGSDGQKLGKCGDGKEGGAYAACLSAEKARKLGPKGRASFVRRKRANQKKGGDAKKGRQKSKGKKPVYTKTKAENTMKLREFIRSTINEVRMEEKINLFVEKNVPTNPSKWSYYKSQAKKKFDVYPSAYANAWAAKQYKAAGGSWKKGK